MALRSFVVESDGGVVRLVQREVVHPQRVSDGAHLRGVVDRIHPVEIGGLVLHLRVRGLGERRLGVGSAGKR